MEQFNETPINEIGLDDALGNVEINLTQEQIQRKQEEDQRKQEEFEKFKDIPLVKKEKPKGTFPHKADGTLVGNQKGSKVVGRQQKKTKEAIKSIQYVMGLCEKHMEEDIKALTPLQRVRLWVDCNEYVRPKMTRIEQTGEDGGPLRHRHTILLRPQETDIEIANKATPNEIEEEITQELLPEFPDFPEFSQTINTVEENGILVHNVSTIRNLPPISDEQYHNTIPETPIEILK